MGVVIHQGESGNSGRGKINGQRDGLAVGAAGGIGDDDIIIAGVVSGYTGQGEGVARGAGEIGAEEPPLIRGQRIARSRDGEGDVVPDGC